MEIVCGMWQEVLGDSGVMMTNATSLNDLYMYLYHCFDSGFQDILCSHFK